MKAIPTIATRPGGSVSSSTVLYVDIDPVDAVSIDVLTRAVASNYDSSTASSLLAAAPGIAHWLPRSVIGPLQEFRLHENASSIALRGMRVNDHDIGPTPSHWRDQPSTPYASTLRAYEVYLVLLASLLGDIFGFSTLQGGRLVHNVMPMPSEELEQSGHGTVGLQWHTEDGFHPHRCDYLLLMCLRNHDAVPTTVASIDDLPISPRHRDVLAEHRYVIRPDTEHVNQARALAATTGTDVANSVQRMHDNPERTAVLFGHSAAPYLRVDPAFMMPAQPGDIDAGNALAELVAALDHRLVEVPLAAGDVLIIDNYRAVHGRSPFVAQFNGSDRWLKKAIVTRDLRRSRAHRNAAHDRILQ